MTNYKPPGVYVEEKSIFPPFVAEVKTAVPALIGYTEKARRREDNDLKLDPTRIFSLTAYELYFGRGKKESFTVDIVEDSSTEILSVRNDR